MAEIALMNDFRILTINTEVPFFPELNKQQSLAADSPTKFSERIDFITSFTTENWGKFGWQDKAIEQIEHGLNRGAVGVKIWKNIGMELTDREGNYIMADHPSFAPIYSFLAENNIPLLAHLGEPRNCWLPVSEMTVTSDAEYFSGHPQYHMYLHPEFPSYKEQLKARDRLLADHPNLKFIGAHLASLEWSVDEIAKWLDQHPNSGVDLAERVCHLQHQASGEPKKVKEFIMAYQDRIIYGSDQIDDGSLPENNLKATLQEKWLNEFLFFSEHNVQTAWNVEKPFLGLGLKETVLKKIFHDNALSYYPQLRS
ncbi:MAG: amidohydrolase family protein [Balneolaceae bacterium]|nr:amidohydrolase family protein [Balneolaceae bacterium]MCH8548430.1 amidohydrolase [Balneolaceae bacterium]